MRGRSASPDWDQVAGAGPAAAYRALRRSLADGHCDGHAGPAFALLVTDPEARERVERALTGRARRRARAAVLYEELMRAPAHPEVLYDYLRRRAIGLLAHASRDDRASSYGWGLASAWYAGLRAFEATGQRRFLGLLASTFERVLEQRDCVLGLEDECRGGVGRGWGSTRFVRGRYTASITTTGRIAYPVLLFCRLVGGSRSLERALGEQAARFLPAVEEALADLDGDFVAVGEEGYYQGPVSPAAEPLNHTAWAGAAYLALHELTGRRGHRERAARLARFLLASMYDDGAGHPVWDYAPDPGTHRGRSPERLWKAQVTVRFVAAAAEAGLVLTGEHLRAVGSTLAANVFLPGGRINTRIDRVVEPFETFRGVVHGGYGGLIGLVEAESYCPGLRDRIAEVVATRPEVGGWLGSDAAAMGYACLLHPPPGART